MHYFSSFFHFTEDESGKLSFSFFFAIDENERGKNGALVSWQNIVSGSINQLVAYILNPQFLPTAEKKIE